MTKAQYWAEKFNAGNPENDGYDEFMEQIEPGAYDTYKHVENIEIDSGRWMAYMQTILKFDDDSYLSLEWAQGLTEYQENEYNYEATVVEPYTETITVTKYRAV